jgi:hypothetical protein
MEKQRHTGSQVAITAEVIAQSALSPHQVTASDGNFGASEHSRPSHEFSTGEQEALSRGLSMASSGQHPTAFPSKDSKHCLVCYGLTNRMPTLIPTWVVLTDTFTAGSAKGRLAEK